MADKTLTMTWNIVDEAKTRVAYERLCSIPGAEIVDASTVEEMAEELVVNFDVWGRAFGVSGWLDLGLER